jgi:UDPglucose 6-dehydrogenase
MALIEVVGQGFVGLTTALLAADAGHEVVGIEVDQERAERLRGGRTPFREPGVEDHLRHLLAEGRLTIEGADYRTREPPVLIVAVPTPTRPEGRIDDAAVVSSLVTFGDPHRHELVVVRSTLTPGHSAILLDRFEALRDSYVHWPEFLNQGRALRETRRPDRVVVGTGSPRAASAMAVLLKSFGFDPELLRWHDVMEAEVVKQFSNAALAANQVLGAELARLCEQAGLDARSVLASVALDARLSPELLGPKPPLVDSCLRKDLTALIASVPDEDSARLLSASLGQAGVQRIAATGRVLRHVRALPRDAGVLIVGAGFSPGVSDTGGSLLWDLLPPLCTSHVEVWDPYAESGALAWMGPAVIVSSLGDALARASVVVLLVDHPEVYEVPWSEVLAALAERGGVILDYCAMFRSAGPEDPVVRAVVHGWGTSSGCWLCAE